MTEQEAAKLIRETMYSDSRILIPTFELEEALRKDKRVPSKEEIDLICMGDEDGEVPIHLRNTFQHVDRVINEYF